jgi:hypothetical protein
MSWRLTRNGISKHFGSQPVFQGVHVIRRRSNWIYRNKEWLLTVKETEKLNTKRKTYPSATWSTKFTEQWKASSSAVHWPLPCARCCLPHLNCTWRPYAATTDPHFRRYYLQQWGNTTFLLSRQYPPRGTAFHIKYVSTTDIHTMYTLFRPHPWLFLNTYLLTCLLTPYSTVLLEKLTGLQLVKKFPAFYGTRRFITAFTCARHLSLSWAGSILFIPPHLTSWISALLLSSHLHLGLPCGLFPSGIFLYTVYNN